MVHAMNKDTGFSVIFALNGQQFALPLTMVEKVVRALAITPLPKAPAIVSGIIDFHGEIVPVMDIRLRLGLPPRPIALSDQIIIARTPHRPIAFAVDKILDVVEWRDEDVVPAEAVAAGVEFLGGVLRNQAGVILMYDPGAFFLPAEHQQLDQLTS
jgi:purine-binding chemotaxis protein CheW